MAVILDDPSARQAENIVMLLAWSQNMVLLVGSVG